MKKDCVLQATGGKWQKSEVPWQTLEMLENLMIPYVSGFPAKCRVARNVARKAATWAWQKEVNTGICSR